MSDSVLNFLLAIGPTIGALLWPISEKLVKRRVKHRHRHWVLIAVAVVYSVLTLIQQQNTEAKSRAATARIEQRFDALSTGPIDLDAAINRRLLAYLKYAQEWNYMGATPREDDNARLLVPSVPLVRTFTNDKRRLDLGVFNNSGGQSGIVRLDVVVPKGVSVETKGCWTQPFWRRLAFGEARRTYTCNLWDMGNKRGFHNDYPLFLRFPRAAAYQAKYLISGPDVEDLSGAFTMVIEQASQ